MTPTQCGTYDYDCNGSSTQQMTSLGTSCAHVGILCDHDGWTNSIPQCGVAAPWTACLRTTVDMGMSIQIVCTLQRQTQTQACR